jgi:hypothetical protein
MRTNYTLDELRQAHPDRTESELRELLEILNRPAAPRGDRWAAENQVPETPLDIGSDGLTGPERELNEFADENALPRPFPPPRKAKGR